MPKPWENSSGCADPTAYAATKPIIKEEERVSDLMHVIREVSRWAGFDIINRIEFRDRKSGHTFK